MLHENPRILIAGTGSGCGKTTITAAILKALKNRGLVPAAFKCGPDYIDPMFHTEITGTACTNLDSFFFSRNTLNYLLSRNSEGKDISVIEGVMGFYDGIGGGSTAASTYEIAQLTDSPVILITDAKGLSLSALAVVQGFRTFLQDNRICGVIFNRCSEHTYRILAEKTIECFGGKITPLGFMPAMPDCSLESRHLGLITAAEVRDLEEKTERLAAQAERSIRLDTLISIAAKASPVSCSAVSFPETGQGIRIAAAEDKAFCFYYEDNFRALREMGAEIVPFSPMKDPELPDSIHGLYIGGGYPELYTEEMARNGSMKASIRKSLAGGLPCIAECGGFMYLNREINGAEMVGALPGKCFDTGKLNRFGYIRLKADSDNLLCKAGEEIPAHEFHYWDCDRNGNGFTAEKPSGKSWSCVVTSDSLYAGFPHFHFYAAPQFAISFIEACRRYRENKQ